MKVLLPAVKPRIHADFAVDCIRVAITLCVTLPMHYCPVFTSAHVTKRIQQYYDYYKFATLLPNFLVF